MRVLALNCGSSSFKYGLYAVEDSAAKLLAEGEAEERGGDFETALNDAFEDLKAKGFGNPDLIGHRIVHGGRRHRDHVRITPAVLKELGEGAEFAPLHVGPALNVVAAAQRRWPSLPQVACLDTAFHQTMPDVGRTFALPQDVRDAGVERYGFHGLSLESIVDCLSPLPSKLVVAHLGGGCSVTAIRDGKSIDTTMGLTPTGGIIMGTRSGNLDPGVLLYLLQTRSTKQINDVVNHKSGLLGVSGCSSDMRELVAARNTNAQADLALRLFAYQVRQAIAAMAAALEGVDVLVFTGGIGEHSHAWREEVGTRLGFLGSFETRTMHSDEDRKIAEITARLGDAPRSTQ